jgi:hypothetical protein
MNQRYIRSKFVNIDKHTLVIQEKEVSHKKLQVIISRSMSLRSRTLHSILLNQSYSIPSFRPAMLFITDPIIILHFLKITISN